MQLSKAFSEFLEASACLYFVGYLPPHFPQRSPANHSWSWSIRLSLDPIPSPLLGRGRECRNGMSNCVAGMIISHETSQACNYLRFQIWPALEFRMQSLEIPCTPIGFFLSKSTSLAKKVIQDTLHPTSPAMSRESNDIFWHSEGAHWRKIK